MYQRLSNQHMKYNQKCGWTHQRFRQTYLSNPRHLTTDLEDGENNEDQQAHQYPVL